MALFVGASHEASRRSKCRGGGRLAFALGYADGHIKGDFIEQS
jgi:hypothetical protein